MAARLLSMKEALPLRTEKWKFYGCNGVNGPQNHVLTLRQKCQIQQTHGTQ